MDALRVAAQQALEALCTCGPEQRSAIAALRAALTQQAEPVAYRHQHGGEWEYYDAPTGQDCADCQALYAAPQAARQAEPVVAARLHDGSQWPPVARQALTALEMEATSPPLPETAAAMEALRAALAEPEHAPGCALLKIPSRDCDCQPVGPTGKEGLQVQQAEPVAWMFQHDETGRICFEGNDGINTPETFLKLNRRYALVCPLYAAPPAQQARPPAESPTITVDELAAALGWGVTGPSLGKSGLLQRVASLVTVGHQVLAALKAGWVAEGDPVAVDLRARLTPPAEERGCLTCAYVERSLVERPCFDCTDACHWEQRDKPVQVLLRAPWEMLR